MKVLAAPSRDQLRCCAAPGTRPRPAAPLRPAGRACQQRGDPAAAAPARRTARLLLQAAPQPPESLEAPDLGAALELAPPPGGAQIFVFGAMHGSTSTPPDAAEFILSCRPAAVVVETALNRVHGAATGASARREDVLGWTPEAGPEHVGADPRARAFANCGAQLAAAAPELFSEMWGGLASGPQRMCGEQLSYVAAFAAGAEVVFGDRPKRLTYARMLHLPTAADLDESFALKSALNYHELATLMTPPTSGGLVEHIMITERDAVLLSSLHDASLAAGPGATVVGVVGASHLAGMRHLWASDSWRALVDPAAVPTKGGPAAVAGGALHAPEPSVGNEPPEAAGVRRALLESVLRLTCRRDVLNDLTAALPPAERGTPAGRAYALTQELYGCSRMLLAVLSREQLQEVCSSWRCDMWDLLEPLRAVRPINGGPGFDEELVLELRTLNFELG